MGPNQSESSILYHVVQMDQSESRKPNLHKRGRQGHTEECKKRTTTEVKFNWFIYIILGYMRGHVSHLMRLASDFLFGLN